MQFAIWSIVFALTSLTSLASSQNLAKDNSAKHNGNETESGRSMSVKENKSSRGGRMLDLDLMAGDIGKEEKITKDTLISGQRQSRILNEDIVLEQSGGKLDARTTGKRTKAKKMAISGFIPIVSLESAKEGKHLEDQLDNEEGSENEQQDKPSAADLTGSTRNQLVSSFGAQTSLGHASFGPQNYASDQQQQANSQWQPAQSNHLEQLDAGARASNRRPLGLLGNLPQPSGLISSLMRPGQSASQLQGPMNQPGIGLGLQEPPSDCMCVSIFQCKNGYLSESQLSRGQIQQIVGIHPVAGLPGANQYQVPRSLNTIATPLQQQQQATGMLPNLQNNVNDLYYTATPQPSSLASQIMAQGGDKMAAANDQQLANDIYEQLRKSIEGQQLEQQLRQQQQLQMANYQLDERSRQGADNSSSSQQADTQERSLINPLGRRSGGQASRSCGLMRTCCKIPAHLISSPMLMRPQNSPFGRPQGQVQSMGLQQPLAAIRPPSPPAQYQLLQPSSQQPIETSHLVGQLAHEQLMAGSGLVPSQRPSGGFMAGRCGIRQAMGISGRVQNVQPAPGSETTAEFGEFPSHVAILKRISPGDSLFVCSGVLVSNQWVATAAHCIRRQRAEELKLRLGEWDVNHDDEFYPFVESNVREVVIHPEFQPSSLVNDIALMRLDHPVDPQQMPHIAPACLPVPEEQHAGQRCWVAGWGKDAFGQGGSFQSVLKKVDLPIVSRQDCEMALRYQTKLGKFFRLHQSAVCAGGERGKDACEGDGGAGLYCHDQESGLTRAVGLVSWGVGCGQRGVPGVYTNMAHFYRWIENVVAASGEESLYSQDRPPTLGDDLLKGLINERSNSNVTLSSGIQLSAANGTGEATEMVTQRSDQLNPEADPSRDLESRAG